MSQPLITKILLLSCTQKKRNEPTQMPALRRYDGPTFVLLRKYLAEQPQYLPFLYILSAEFGLISAAKLIPSYDRKMTRARATELRQATQRKWSRILAQYAQQGEVFICLGQNYRYALGTEEKWIGPAKNLIYANGSPGQRLTQLRFWLAGPAPLPVGQVARQPPKGVELCGVTLNPSGLDIVGAALGWMEEDAREKWQAQAWRVIIGSQAVSPKWLVSRLTGLPVSKFHTDQARRVLRQLGLIVECALPDSTGNHEAPLCK